MAEDRIAVIPARGGSKRIPRKNIKPFRGTPLLARTIEMLSEVEAIDRVVVSTDDDEIAEVALSAGAEVPFRRPADLANDHAATRPVVRHAIEALETLTGGTVGEVCVAYPAAVFVTPADVDEAFHRLIDNGCQFVMSATAFPAPVQRGMTTDEEGRVAMLWPEHVNTRSQDLAQAYHDAGQFYWGTRSAWLHGPHPMQANTLLQLLPHWRVQDIDTPDDWERAEMIHRLLEERAADQTPNSDS